MTLDLQQFIRPFTGRMLSPVPKDEEESFIKRFQKKAIEIARFVKKQVEPKIISPIPEDEARLELRPRVKSPAPPARVASPTTTPLPSPTSIPIESGSTPIESGSISTPTPTPTPRQVELARNPAIAKFKITSKVRDSISKAGQKFDLPSELLFDIALQESSFRADHINTTPEGKKAGNPTGLFQFTDGTWKVVKKFANDPNSSLYKVLPSFNRKDPLTNALAAAYLIKFGQLGRWDASKDVWGSFYSDDELEPYYSQTLSYNR